MQNLSPTVASGYNAGVHKGSSLRWRGWWPVRPLTIWAWAGAAGVGLLSSGAQARARVDDHQSNHDDGHEDDGHDDHTRADDSRQDDGAADADTAGRKSRTPAAPARMTGPAPVIERTPAGKRQPGLPPMATLLARYGPALVEVEHGAHKTTGFAVTSAGMVCAVISRARPGEPARLRRLVEGAVVEVTARVVATDPSGLALLAPDSNGAMAPVTDGDAPEAPEPWVALGVRTDGKTPGPEAWLVGLWREGHGQARRASETRPGATGAVGSLLQLAADGRLSLLLPAPVGAPVLDRRGQVIAVVVKSSGGGRSTAVSAGRIGDLAATLTGDAARAAAR